MRDDPRRLSRLAKPLLIDEWQHYPPVWDRVRHDVDAGAASGSYILAGSSFPSEAPKHSGAGRIVTLRMRPLSLAERQLAEPTVSLAALLDGTSDIDGDCDLTLEDYTDEITTSGFPGIRPLPPEVRRDALDGYLTAVVERDFVDAGRPVRRPQTLKAWLSAYAAASSTTATYNAILDAATPGLPDKPSRSTIVAYREILQRMCPDDRDVRHLRWLKDRLGDDLTDAAVITTGTAAYRRPDGIAVIPAALLGP